jgi:hypothetical protein
VNDGYRAAPWADALVALDEDWWTIHGDRVVASFEGECFSVSPMPRDHWGVTYLNPIIRDDIVDNWESPSYGADSGQFAIQIAVLMGAKRILLLGYDMGDGPEGERHWFGDHPKKLRNVSPYELFLEKYRKAVPSLRRMGVEVINCSRRTKLECFPRATLKESLCATS